jgi:hypothetical protein
MNTVPYKEKVLAAMKDSLIPLGFKKKGSHFLRQTNDLIHLVSLQASASSTTSILKVTVNLGIWVSSLEAAGKKPDIWSCHWQQRLGHLMPINNDYWWKIASDREAELAAHEIGAALKEYGIPSLNKIMNITDLIQLWEKGQSPGLTQVLAERYLAKLQK